MADITRAEELVQTIDGDPEFQAAIQAAPTVDAKRKVLDGRGFADVGLDEMRAYVESKGGTLRVPERGKDLSDEELAAVAGGTQAITEDELFGLPGSPPPGFAAAAVAT